MKFAWIVLIALVVAISTYGEATAIKCSFPVEDEYPALENELEELTGGYCDHLGRSVPLMVSGQSYHNLPQPVHTIGSITWYDNGVMEQVIDAQVGQLPDGYLDGIAVMSCFNAHNHSTVYIKAGGGEWVGPFLAVDCPAQQHMYPNIVLDAEVAEVGFETAKLLGMVEIVDEALVINAFSLQDVEVCISSSPHADCGGSPTNLADWWLESAVFYAP